MGEFVGISYEADGEFLGAGASADPDGLDGRIEFGLEQNFFFHNTFRSRGTGFGDVVYTAVPDAASVPEPTPLIGLIGIGAAALRRKRQAD